MFINQSKFFNISGSFRFRTDKSDTFFSCHGVGLYLDFVDAFYVVGFLESTHRAFEACNVEWGLWDLWLQIEYSSLEALVDNRFVEWELIQRLYMLRLELVGHWSG